MHVWTIHTRLPRQPAAGTPAAGRVVLVREGFAWGAALFTLPWLLARRLWLEAAIHTGAAALLAGLLPADALVPAALALQFLAGAEARDLQRGAMRRRGFTETLVIAAPDEERALDRLVTERPDLAPGLLRGGFA